MKLLCIKGTSDNRLRSGEIYTAIGEALCTGCKSASWQIAEIPDKAVRRGRCRWCLTPILLENAAPCAFYGKSRFIPWNPDELGISEEEVRRLYSPQPVKVDIEPLFTISPLDYMLLEAWRLMSR